MFPRDGYAIFPDVLPDVSALLAAADTLPHTRAGARGALAHPAIAAAARGPLLALARTLLAPDAAPFRATLFDKSLETNWRVTWHQDRTLPLRARHDAPGWGPWTTKDGVLHAHAPAAILEQVVALRLHLDDSTAANGPLRVLPGTHAAGVLSPDAIDRAVATIPPTDCLATRGSVIAMRPLLLHASSKAQTSAPRRVIHIEYASASLALGHGLELATSEVLGIR